MNVVTLTSQINLTNITKQHTIVISNTNYPKDKKKKKELTDKFKYF